MSEVRLIALGSHSRGDDAAALLAAASISCPDVDVLVAGRPGASLVDMLEGEAPVVLIDVTRSRLEPGAISVIELRRVPELAVTTRHVSSHGFGIAQALQLACNLGRTLPHGAFVGLEGQSFAPAETLSAPVAHALARYIETIRETVTALAHGHAIESKTLGASRTHPA